MNIQNKKGELSITVVIVAVICLIVLAVLIAILVLNSRSFNQGAQSCTDKGGTCVAKAVGCSSLPQDKAPYFIVGGTDCSNNKNAEQVCCVPLGKQS